MHAAPSGSVLPARIRLLDDDPTTAPGQPLDVLGDSAYGTGDALAALEDAGHPPVIKPWPLRPAVEGGFTLDNFTLDEQQNALTCPNGVTRPLTASGNAVFGGACQDCPLRARCTTSRRGRKVVVGRHWIRQRDHRARAATAEHLEP